MALTCTHHEDSCELALEGALTIMEATELRDQLALALVTAHGPVQMDLSRVTELDSSGLQLLLALLREGGQVRLSALSAVVRARIERFGLGAALRLEGGQDGA
ncbi:STAS domain-containing protein [Vogesella sp. LIG4]|uniref:STAS domain-containing protein n=1 Tax=Vogesella sp. LIG4 TaxID=1192162 RepID=UPI00081F8A92|nr:STAS domain-containing protein [Vogesella sp. LIG4]SCK29394.1 anti-anti-sigma factor [Vogesella sp. LIG4]